MAFGILQSTGAHPFCSQLLLILSWLKQPRLPRHYDYELKPTLNETLNVFVGV